MRFVFCCSKYLHCKSYSNGIINLIIHSCIFIFGRQAGGILPELSVSLMCLQWPMDKMQCYAMWPHWRRCVTPANGDLPATSRMQQQQIVIIVQPAHVQRKKYSRIECAHLFLSLFSFHRHITRALIIIRHSHTHKHTVRMHPTAPHGTCKTHTHRTSNTRPANIPFTTRLPLCFTHKHTHTTTKSSCVACLCVSFALFFSLSLSLSRSPRVHSPLMRLVGV